MRFQGSAMEVNWNLKNFANVILVAPLTAGMEEGWLAGWHEKLLVPSPDHPPVGPLVRRSRGAKSSGRREGGKWKEIKRR